jgi:predicted dehydrogenase
MTRVGFVGAGLIGKERLGALSVLQRRGRTVRAVGVVDPYLEDLDAVAAAYDVPVSASLDALIAIEPDLVVVSVPHDSAVGIVGSLLDAGVRVLMEKPLGCDLAEAREIAARCASDGQLVVGHNYRFFAGVAALLADVGRGAFGTLMGASMLLGHGGAPPDKLSWKLDPVRAGGGCLIDPGIHLLDLANVMNEGVPSVAGGVTSQGFWNTGIEEECRLVFAGVRLPAIDIHVSVARWCSTFRVEVFGHDGYGIVAGRGRSYGPQTYRRGARWGWQSGISQAASEELVLTTRGEEVFADELEALLFPNGEGPSVATVADSLRNMELLDACRAAVGIARGCELVRGDVSPDHHA